MKYFTLILLTIVSFGVSAKERTIAVSMVQLLSSPEKYVGKTEQFVGYIQWDTTYRAYLTKDHAMMMDTMSSFALWDSTENGEITQNCKNSYAILEGHFSGIKGVAHKPITVKWPQ